ncbi:HAD family hydrolase [Phytomonospora endophytica]|uniref:Phosphoserine phosphatase n=1 Tax=Phytomonospora endophytica TaxID=714109 RepID=A0A841FWW5_9ACTN|nr:HAD family hydrolase [Phytomonospora endophytica]MBB6037837.1 phosphoserine phosphatase [Phytomonospora endophytica]GIG68736.1 acid phosphatase [Phytomonospora endophytica]
MSTERLPSWRPGAARDAILGHLDGIGEVPVDERVAYLDNDGTMWCERPGYVQYDFFVDVLRRRAAEDPSLARRPELAAVLDDDAARIGELGLAKIAGALAALCDGLTPAEFASMVDDFVERYRHPVFGVGLASLVYRPMLELIEELRAHDFTVGIVTGGGTEFVRRISSRLYGVAPELVVGTMIGYEFGRDDRDRPVLRRTVSSMGAANEGPAKISHIQSQTGRAPIVAAGNSGGDREMLEWARSSAHGGLAILIDHDDAEREFAYRSMAATFEEAEPITAVAERLGWTTVSMADDWDQVFPSRS